MKAPVLLCVGPIEIEWPLTAVLADGVMASPLQASRRFMRPAAGIADGRPKSYFDEAGAIGGAGGN
jgi:hypothetical protein